MTHLSAIDTREGVAWGWLGLFTALAAVLRVAGADGGLWYDEILALVESARSPVIAIVTTFPSNNQHTFFTLMAHASLAAFGEHAWSLRLPALICGTATVPACYLLARSVTSATEALMVSLLVAVGYQFVWFSQNARGYATLALLAVACNYLLLRAVRRGTMRDWAWYAGTAALGAYTHLSMILLVVSHALLCALPLAWPGSIEARGTRWKRPAMGFVLAAAFTLVLYAPLLVGVRRFFVEEEDAAGGATAAWALLEIVRGLHLGWGSVGTAIAGGGLLVAGAWSYARQSPFLLGSFVLPSLTTAVVTIAMQRPVRPRLLFFVAGFGLLILVRGVFKVAEWWAAARPGRAPLERSVGVGIVVLIAAAAAAPLVANYSYPKQDFEGALRFVESERAEAEPVVTVGAAGFIYQKYYQRPWPRICTAADLQGRRGEGRRVWVVHTLDSYIRASTPDLMRLLEQECETSRVFRGTLSDGDVSVCALPPIR